MSEESEVREIEASLLFSDDEVDIRKVRQAEELLREAGVSFDAGSGLVPDAPVSGHVVEWHLDWSLEGAYLVQRGDGDE